MESEYKAVFEDGKEIKGNKLLSVIQQAMARKRKTGIKYEIRNKEGKVI